MSRYKYVGKKAYSRNRVKGDIYYILWEWDVNYYVMTKSSINNNPFSQHPRITAVLTEYEAEELVYQLLGEVNEKR